MDPTNPRMSFTNMLNSTNPENPINHPNYPYPHHLGYPNMPPPNYGGAPPNYGGAPMTMYNYGGTPMPTQMSMYGGAPPNYPAQPGCGMVNNYPPGSSTQKMKTKVIPEENISCDEEEVDTFVPPFCTQESSRGDAYISKGKKGSAGERWTINEEKALAEAWVSISTDPVIGSNQDGDAFWRRVTSYFNKYNKDGNQRNEASVRGRFNRAQPDINRFNENYNQINNQYLSGWSDDQKRQAAREMYTNAKGKKTNFKLEHMWEICKLSVKWNSGREDEGKSQQLSGSKRCSSNTDEEVSARPMGTKAAKASKQRRIRNNKESSCNDDLANKLLLIQEEKLAMMKQMRMMEEIAVLNIDTSGMTEEAKRLQEIFAKQIRDKHNM